MRSSSRAAFRCSVRVHSRRHHLLRQSTSPDWTPAGEDAFERGDGGGVGTYGGFALNEAGRLWALSYDVSRLTDRHHQCDAYTVPHMMRAIGNFRVWEERDPVNQRLVAMHVWGQTTEGHRVIWMDGRPHPPAWAPHTFRGFSTGEFVGNALRVYTTHTKQEWAKRNGTPQSDQATTIEFMTRHGDRLNDVVVTTDPVFMAEPMVRSNDFSRTPVDHQAWLYACDDGEQVLDRPKDVVPHFPFGKQPFIREFADRFKVSLAASLGGPETMYPEFAERAKTLTEADATPLRSPKLGIANETSKAINPEPNDGNIHVYKLRDQIYLLLGDGANIVVSAGDQGAFVIDTGAGKLTARVVAAIGQLTSKPIQFIANTSFHPDHVGGNAKLADAGADLSLPGSFFDFVGANLNAAAGAKKPIGSVATMIAHTNVQRRMHDAKYPSDAVPQDTFLEQRRRKFYNGQGVELFYEPNAVTDGDSIVCFRKSDVIVAGDIFTTTQYPFIDVANGGTIQGLIKALNDILDRTVFEHEGDGGTIVVPAHGYVSNEHEVVEYRDMAVIVRDRVQVMLNEGATVQQVQAARLTADYDTRYGANTGDWTTATFVEAIYRTLKPAARPAPARSPRR
ncbi:MAG: MBL fold metallo-hydrolase [Acidobacteriota bacterium]